jgi:hypothetical protein
LMVIETHESVAEPELAVTIGRIADSSSGR